MNPQVCPFCSSSVSLIDSAKVYRRSYGFIYLCDRYPYCDARVTCHPGSDKPLGTLANRELRQWRSLAHRQFDPLWQSGIFTNRQAAYKWLVKTMELSPTLTHVGMFNIRQCRRVIAVVRQFEQIADSPLIKQEKNMKSRAMAINLDDSFDLVAVWQWEDRKWQLLQLARPQKAIALCRQNSMMRLVFPTGVNPNYLKKESRSRKSKLVYLVLT